MKVIKKTKEYIIYQKSSGRYAVKGADKKWINAAEKIKNSKKFSNLDMNY